MFELVQVSGRSLYPSSALFRQFQYSNSDEQNYVRQVFKLAQNKRARIHLLQKGGRPYGFIALSVQDFNQLPSIIVEYLFISAQFRRRQYSELGLLRISEFLIGQSLLMSAEISQKLPFKYIALQIAGDGLETFYQRHGFKRTEGTDWMSLVIPPLP